VNAVEQPEIAPEGDGLGLFERLGRLPANPWFAYLAVLAVQLRGFWGVWERDLSAGDSASYFANSSLWSEDLLVKFTWSPLYGAFLGTVHWITDDLVSAFYVHRVLIVVVLAVLILALMRRLLPPWAALVCACWWASLPIIFDSVYEVHLFAALPLIGAVLLLTGDPTLKRRGAAIGLLVASAVLVRQEAGFIAIVLVAAMAMAGFRARRAGRGRSPRALAVAFGVPLLVAAALVGGALERSVIKGGALSKAFEAKHTLNVCQVYTTNLVQRKPEAYTGNPFTGCQEVMSKVFDEPEPTYTEAWRQNPRAMSAFVAWNLWLLPQGLELALFNAAAGDDNPDFKRAHLNEWWAGALAIVLLALVIAGGIYLRRGFEQWRPLLHRQRWAWLALAVIALVVLAVIVLTQRPRPSYMFGMTAGLMALAGLAAAVLARRFALERWAAAGSAILPLILLVALPFHYRDAPTPVRDAYERLQPVIAEVGPDPVLVSPAFATNLCQLLLPNEPCEGKTAPVDVPVEPSGRGFAAALDREGATVFYSDELSSQNAVIAPFLADPRGWRVAESGSTDAGQWSVLVRDQS